MIPFDADESYASNDTYFVAFYLLTKKLEPKNRLLRNTLKKLPNLNDHNSKSYVASATKTPPTCSEDCILYA